jgi:hypothetical protein
MGFDRLPWRRLDRAWFRDEEVLSHKILQDEPGPGALAAKALQDIRRCTPRHAIDECFLVTENLRALHGGEELAINLIRSRRPLRGACGKREKNEDQEPGDTTE